MHAMHGMHDMHDMPDKHHKYDNGMQGMHESQHDMTDTERHDTPSMEKTGSGRNF